MSDEDLDEFLDRLPRGLRLRATAAVWGSDDDQQAHQAQPGPLLTAYQSNPQTPKTARARTARLPKRPRRPYGRLVLAFTFGLCVAALGCFLVCTIIFAPCGILVMTWSGVPLAKTLKNYQRRRYVYNKQMEGYSE